MKFFFNPIFFSIHSNFSNINDININVWVINGAHVNIIKKFSSKNRKFIIINNKFILYKKINLFYTMQRNFNIRFNIISNSKLIQFSGYWIKYFMKHNLQKDQQFLLKALSSHLLKINPLFNSKSASKELWHTLLFMNLKNSSKINIKLPFNKAYNNFNINSKINYIIINSEAQRGYIAYLNINLLTNLVNNYIKNFKKKEKKKKFLIINYIINYIIIERELDSYVGPSWVLKLKKLKIKQKEAAYIEQVQRLKNKNFLFILIFEKIYINLYKRKYGVFYIEYEKDIKNKMFNVFIFLDNIKIFSYYIFKKIKTFSYYIFKKIKIFSYYIFKKIKIFSYYIFKKIKIFSYYIFKKIKIFSYYIFKKIKTFSYYIFKKFNLSIFNIEQEKKQKILELKKKIKEKIFIKIQYILELEKKIDDKIFIKIQYILEFGEKIDKKIFIKISAVVWIIKKIIKEILKLKKKIKEKIFIKSPYILELEKKIDDKIFIKIQYILELERKIDDKIFIKMSAVVWIIKEILKLKKKIKEKIFIKIQYILELEKKIDDKIFIKIQYILELERKIDDKIFIKMSAVVRIIKEILKLKKKIKEKIGFYTINKKKLNIKLQSRPHFMVYSKKKLNLKFDKNNILKKLKKNGIIFFKAFIIAKKEQKLQEDRLKKIEKKQVKTKDNDIILDNLEQKKNIQASVMSKISANAVFLLKIDELKKIQENRKLKIADYVEEIEKKKKEEEEEAKNKKEALLLKASIYYYKMRIKNIKIKKQEFKVDKKKKQFEKFNLKAKQKLILLINKKRLFSIKNKPLPKTYIYINSYIKAYNIDNNPNLIKYFIIEPEIKRVLKPEIKPEMKLEKEPEIKRVLKPEIKLEIKPKITLESTLEKISESIPEKKYVIILVKILKKKENKLERMLGNKGYIQKCDKNLIKKIQNKKSNFKLEFKVWKKLTSNFYFKNKLIKHRKILLNTNFIWMYYNSAIALKNNINFINKNIKNKEKIKKNKNIEITSTLKKKCKKSLLDVELIKKLIEITKVKEYEKKKKKIKIYNKKVKTKLSWITYKEQKHLKENLFKLKKNIFKYFFKKIFKNIKKRKRKKIFLFSLNIQQYTDIRKDTILKNKINRIINIYKFYKKRHTNIQKIKILKKNTINKITKRNKKNNKVKIQNNLLNMVISKIIQNYFNSAYILVMKPYFKYLKKKKKKKKIYSSTNNTIFKPYNYIYGRFIQNKNNIYFVIFNILQNIYLYFNMFYDLKKYMYINYNKLLIQNLKERMNILKLSFKENGFKHLFFFDWYQYGIKKNFIFDLLCPIILETLEIDNLEIKYFPLENIMINNLKIERINSAWFLFYTKYKIFCEKS